jgi:hypothetical protein
MKKLLDNPVCYCGGEDPQNFKIYFGEPMFEDGCSATFYCGPIEGGRAVDDYDCYPELRRVFDSIEGLTSDDLEVGVAESLHEIHVKSALSQKAIWQEVRKKLVEHGAIHDSECDGDKW